MPVHRFATSSAFVPLVFALAMFSAFAVEHSCASVADASPVLLADASPVSGDPMVAVGALPAPAPSPSPDQAVDLVTHAAQAAESGEWSSLFVIALSMLPFGLSWLTHRYSGQKWLQSPVSHVLIQAVTSAAAGCMTAALAGHFDPHHVLVMAGKCFAGSIAGWVLKQSQPITPGTTPVVGASVTA